MAVDLKGFKLEKVPVPFGYNPFPKLRDLQGIYFRPSDKESIPDLKILSAIFQANPKIKMFHLLHSGYIFQEDLKKYLGIFHAIQSAELNTLGIDTCYRRINLLRQSIFPAMLNPLVCFNWPLTVLRLKSVNAGKPGSLGLLFSFLNNFPTLETLCLVVDEIFIGGFLPFLRLPNLKEFQFMKMFDENEVIDYSNSNAYNVNMFFSLQFLFFCRGLKSLSWEYRSSKAKLWKIRRFMVNHECHEEMINFRAGLRDLRYSNIWEVFPNLEYVKTVKGSRKLDVRIAEEWTEVKGYRNAVLVSSKKMFGVVQ